jgi:2,5-diamino-6-hydroxy-4-(5-phosphoribosylamino)pyrimidine 1'-reductase
LHVIVGGFMSIDGKVAPKNRVGQTFAQFMTPQHKKLLHTIRAEADAIVVGIGTVLADDPALTVRDVNGANPLRVILDSKARTPLNAKVLCTDQAPTLIAVAQNASKTKIDALKAKNAEIFVSQDFDRVNLTALLQMLAARGIRRVFVEGGSEVRWSFFKENLVDELFVWVLPYVWGGKEAPTLVDGEGFLGAADAVPLTLTSSEVVDGLLVLWFSVTR